MGSAAAEQATGLRLARALAHPLRHRLFFEYHREITSPSRAARRLDAPLNVVSYHTHVLRRERCIEQVDSRRVRGAVERFYQATVEPVLSDEAWAALPPRLRRGMTHGALSMMWREVRRSAMTGGFDASCVHLSRTPLDLDEQGAQELNGLLCDLLDAAIRIQSESQARAAGAASPVELVLLHFGRASAPEAWNRRQP